MNEKHIAIPASFFTIIEHIFQVETTRNSLLLIMSALRAPQFKLVFTVTVREAGFPAK